MCGVKLNERKKSEELRELLGLEPVSLMIKKSRLRWFGKDDNDWVKRRMTTTSIILSSNKIQNGDSLVQGNPGPPGKWPLKRRETE